MELHHDLNWTLAELARVLHSGEHISLHPETATHIAKNRAFLLDKIARSEAPIYGINTGFGDLCNTSIEAKDMAQLQINLVRSHACGTGPEIESELVRTMLLLKAIGLSHGHSGVQVETVEQLLAFYNAGIYPVVYSQGSLGASGDLAPLAHLSLGLMGEGIALLNGERMPAAQALKQHNLSPIALGAKEGLALLNGTQFMNAYASRILMRADHLANWADQLTALSLEALNGRPEAYHPAIHRVRPHVGQVKVAANLRALLKGSAQAAQLKEHVQDAYCLRCVPQVHGASRDTLDHARRVIETEINAVTDNPTLFEDEDLIISAGNFHGQPLALILDFMAIAVAEFGSISERRVYKLISGQRGLPAFLTPNPGLNSGFMIPQYTAASIVSRNKSLCSPSSVDTIDSSNGQEDHVSMGANAAVKCWEVMGNVEQILGIELFAAAQGFDLVEGMSSSKTLHAIHSGFRNVVPFINDDVIMQPLMHLAKSHIQNTPASIPSAD